MVQYTASLNSDKMMKAVRDMQHRLNPNKKAPRSAFNLRVTDETTSFKLSNYGHNAVTPLFFNQPYSWLIRIPIFISQAIRELCPGFLWLGGGDTDLKLSIIR